MGKILIPVLLLFISSKTYSQTNNQYSIDSTNLVRLSEVATVKQATQSQLAKAYATQHNVPLVYQETDGTLVFLVGVNENGIPQYKAVDNAGAAATTGVNLLQNGSLGLGLAGEGMVVGVWDEGGVSHSEYDTRLFIQQGPSSVHSNHVTGTILASGLNASARGMAPLAQAYTFDFENDEAEMLNLAKPDQTSLILSNHSYGLVTGWRFNTANNSWQWFGDPTVSTSEDYRFGFYSANAQFWDQIAANAPYYSIIKSAGNDRSDIGNGQHPPDCNVGSGYDCISDVSTAKNIITVGAANKVSNYTDKTSVVMSSFSSWGPTDDGRIKPDFSAAGVNLFSTSTNNGYTTLSGTSMATPNASGSLILIQELYKNLNSGNFMKAATLKALAIHTVKEAGAEVGPDYRFGWGLLDVAAAGKLLLDRDGVNVDVKELTLLQGEVYELPLNPKSGQKIKATIAWTDLPGSPVSASLDPTNIMLVHDLDVRIVDDANNTEYPWILDPASPDMPATRGNNIRDNVEKLEFNNPSERPYKLRVSHKGSLQGGKQDFSLIITYTSNNDTGLTYYWVGGSGDWSDLAHWSLSSGGTSAATMPSGNDRIIFDENSFSATGTVSFNQDASAASILWFATEDMQLDLNGHTLTVAGNFIVTSQNLSSDGSGRILFTGTRNEQNSVSLSDNTFPDLTFEFHGDSEWSLENLSGLGTLNLAEGKLTLVNQPVTIKHLVSDTEAVRVLDISNSEINSVQTSSLASTNLELVSANAKIFTADAVPVDFAWNNVDFSGELLLAGADVEFEGDNTLAVLNLAGSVRINGSNAIEALTIQGGSDVKLAAGTTQMLTENTLISSGSEEPVTLSTEGGTSALEFEGYFKLCFDNLVIQNVNVTAEGVINAGLNSEVTGSLNWLEAECTEILFADFSYQYNCAGSRVQFTSTGSGAVSEWSWDFGDPATTQDKAEVENPVYVYPEAGTYPVELTVSDGSETRSVTKQVVIQANDLAENRVILSDGRLFSFRTAPFYQWYKNGELIPGITTRNYDFENAEGSFMVITSNSNCNRISEPYVNLITGLSNEAFDRRVHVYPNPTTGVVTVEVPFTGTYKTEVYNAFGKLTGTAAHSGPKISLSFESMREGIYFLQISHQKFRIVKKVIVRQH